MTVIAFVVAMVVCAGILFGAYRTGEPEGAALLLAILGGLIWLSFMA